MSGVALEKANVVRDLFYEAAVDASSWDQALQALASLVDGWGTGLLVVDKKINRAVDGWRGGPWDPQGLTSYLECYSRIDPVRAYIGVRTPQGTLNSCTRYIDNDFVRHSEFYQDFLIPQGGRYITGGCLHEGDDETVILSVHTGADRGPLEAQEIACMEMLWPSLMTAAQISRKLVLADVSAHSNRLTGMLDAFERLACAAIFVDAAGQLLAMNQRAQMCLGDSIRLSDNRIVARHRDSKADLAGLIASTIDQSHGFHHTKAVGVKRQTGRPLIALGMPILGVYRYGLKAPAAIVLLVDPDEGRNPAEATLVGAFGLTPAEARIASIVGGGTSLDEAAKQLGIQYETARGHLKVIFQKMGVRRQGELVSTLAQIAMVRCE